MNKDRINYLINNPSDVIEDYELIDIYRGKCIVCRHPAYTIHEIHPKSLLISWSRWINRVLLCPVCHDTAHKRGTISSRDYLIEHRNQRLGEYWNIWLTH